MILDEIRAKYPNLAFAVYAMEPGQPVTLETYIDGDVFRWRELTIEECVAQAFPELAVLEPPEAEVEEPAASVFD